MIRVGLRKRDCRVPDGSAEVATERGVTYGK